MNDYNTDWIGRLEPGAKIADKREALAARTARALGVTSSPVPAPWPVLARLPRGPELSRAAASVTRDAVGPPAPVR